MKINLHSFYCIQCGNKAMDLPRNHAFQHERFHRKKLYCPYCKVMINCIECKDDGDVFDFKENFEKGVYKDEAENSLDYLSSSGGR